MITCLAIRKADPVRIESIDTNAKASVPRVEHGYRLPQEGPNDLALPR